MNPRRAWALFFGLWLVVLSGLLPAGPPGVLQLLRLRGLLEERQAEAAQLHTDVAGLEEELVRLQSSSVHQEREIRRVLGYTAPDEIVFEFGEDNAE